MADRHDADAVLVQQLASGRTLTDAAKTAGVSVRTARRRASNPAFMRRVRKARAELLAEAGGRLVASLNAAVLTLSQLLVDDDPNVRLKASDKLITHATRVAELIDLEQRVRLLEDGSNPDHDDHDDDDGGEGEDDEPAEPG